MVLENKNKSSVTGGVVVSSILTDARPFADVLAGNDGWRAAMRYRVQGFRGRIIFVVMLAVMTVGIIQTPSSWIFALIWAVSALLVELIEGRVHLRILKRRLLLTRRDKIAATLMTAGTGLTRGILFAYFFIDFHTGSRILAVILFFGMSVHYLRMFHGSCVLFAAIVGPGVAVLLAGCFASLWMVDGNILAAAVLVTATLIAFAQLIYGARAMYQQMQAVRRSRRRADEVAEEAAKAARAKSEFLAVISHELRTPMNSMLGSAELLRRTELEGEQTEHLSAVLNSGTMLMTLLNDLLDVSKIEAGALKTEIIPVNLRQLVERMHAMWHARASDQGLALQLDIADDVPAWVMADPMRLQQVLFNLLSNALKFTRMGEIRILVETGADASGGQTIELSVTDTGIGISKEVAARLFRPFAQADSSTARKYGGTGLGLSICKGIADALGGRIELESEPGAGARFTLSFPLVETEEVALESERYGDLEVSENVRVLVAEDHAANRRLIGALLRPLGFEIVMACDGREAIERFCNDSFDVIVMDMQMPEMDGVQATRAIRKMGHRGAAIPIVALTANATEDDRGRCIDAGMTDFLTKPLDPRALHATIIRAVAVSSGLLTKGGDDREPGSSAAAA